jgi:hypothetical protein
MANLFKVDFIKGKTDDSDYGQVKHSLVDTATDRPIITLSVSSDKLTSVSNYSREPKRLVFECFPTDWINTYILSGSHEHERYISVYEVKVYRDNVQFFGGIIDTSQLSYDISTGILKITCYDKIKLLSIYSELKHYYSLTSGYQPEWALGYFIQDIEQRIPINIIYYNLYNLPMLHTGDLMLAQVTYNDMQQLPSGGGWTYTFHNTSWLAPKYGYLVDNVANRITFIFAYKKVIQATYPNPASTKYQAVYRGRIYRFFNNICPQTFEYDEKTIWMDTLADLDSSQEEFIAFFVDNGVAESQLDTLTSTGTIYGNPYGTSQAVNQYVASHYDNGNTFPTRFHPGKAYETLKDDETNDLKALQVALMLYNAAIFTDNYGNIIFKNKDSYSTTIIDIADEDVVSLLKKRSNQEKPDTAILETLAGDTTMLQSLISQYLIDFHDSKWSIDITIDQLAKYSISLQSKLRIQGNTYAVTEVEKDYINDEYKIRAWLI